MGESVKPSSAELLDLAFSTALSESINGVGMKELPSTTDNIQFNNVIQIGASTGYDEQVNNHHHQLQQNSIFDQGLDTNQRNLPLQELSALNENYQQSCFTQPSISLNESSNYNFSENPNSKTSKSAPTNITGLKSYLLGDFDGIAILKSYKTLGLLTARLRESLVRKVIKREEDILFGSRTNENELLTFTINKERFEDLTSDIVSLFTGESRGTYFIPYATIKKDGVSSRVNQCGKLYEHFCYRRNLLIEAGVIAPIKKFKPLLNHTSATVRKATANEEAKIEYIIKTIEPIPQLYDYWKETFQVRRAEFQREETDIPTLFQKYRCLRMEFGAELLKIDFDLLMPDKSDIFLYRWPLIRYRLTELLYGLRKPKKAAHCELVQELKHLAADDQDAIVLHLLPTLMKPKNPGRSAKDADETVSEAVPQKKQNICGKGGEKVTQKASESEAQDAFFLVVSTVAGIEEAVKKRKADLHNRQLSIQVLPVFVGTLEKIDSSYVYIDTDIRFRVQSPMHAIDLAFKIFYALDCSYPLDAAHVWLFIQHVGFVIEDPAEKLSVSAKTLKGEVEVVFQS